jgi:hypothetical protein
MLVASRLVLVTSMAARYPGVSLLSLSFGTAGLYFLFVPGIAGRMTRKFAPWCERVIIAGAISGVLVGGAMFSALARKSAGGMALPLFQSFAAFVPVGFLVGSLWEGRKTNAANGFLPAVSGALFAGAMIVAGLGFLGFLGTDAFWKQLFCLTDLSGFFILLASVAVIPGRNTESVQGDPEKYSHGGSIAGHHGGGAREDSLMRKIGIGRKIAEGCRTADVLNDIVGVIAE